MSNLLVVQRVQSKALQRKGTVPLMIEYGVSKETAPYLVSSTSSVMWINAAHPGEPGDVVKAAVRKMTVDAFFGEVLEATISMGRQQEWGNVHPLTLAGLQAAVEHVEFYDLGPVELLIPRTRPVEPEGETDEDEERVIQVDLMPPELRPLLEDIGLPFRPSSWVPDGTIVVVPKDRTFVGVVSKVTATQIAGVVHNAARGIAIVQGPSSDEQLASPALQVPDAG
jgi:hypothetical protein